MSIVNANRELFDVSMAAGADAQMPRGHAPSYCKGYRVVGIPPGDMEDARRKQLAAQAVATNPEAWDEAAWLMNARQKPVNARPYELRTGAEQCAELAIKARWQRVEIVELTTSSAPRGVRPAGRRKG